MYLPVAGTWSRDEDDQQKLWWEKDSPFNLFSKKNNWEQIFVHDDPFVWTSNVDGVDLGQYFSGKHANWDWSTAGQNLAHYLKDVNLEDRNLIAHSHGGQVALYAAKILPINRLITVSTPVRADMQAVMQAALPNIGKRTHTHSDCTDTWQAYGELFDGHLGIIRDMRLADLNIMIPKVGHSNILYNPAYFHYWTDLNLFSHLE
jgi:pimeloyl-ACP methyl ester carboxylesterase